MSFMYKSMEAKHSNWELFQNNQYVSYALLSLGAAKASWFFVFVFEFLIKNLKFVTQRPHILEFLIENDKFV